MRLALVACALIACSVPVAQHAPDTGTGGVDARADSSLDAPPDAPLAPAMLTGSPGATVFGDVVVAQTSQKVTYTIENTGDLASGSLGVALDASDAFALTDDTCSGMTLARHETCTFAVAFAPTAAGAAMTTVHAVASPGGDVARDLSGNGLTPGEVDIVDTGYAFGALAVDAAPLTHTFVIRNAGQVQIGMPAPAISGATDSYAIDSTDCTAALAPAATCHVVVRFDPSTVGGKPGSLVVTSSPGGSDAATLSGTANAHVLVTKVGTGTGNVASNQPGIDCGSACAADFTATPVTLTATPDVGSTFDGWAGDCTGTCSLDLSGARSVSARFTAITPTLTVALAGNGTGSVGSSPAGIACSPMCSADFGYGASVTLSATAATGSTFSGWSGACSGVGTCTVTMDQVRAVTATFALDTYTLTVNTSGSGTGTVAANPAGPTYPYNTQVTLTATPAQGSTFAGWTGCTSSSNTCTVTMDQARSVSAAFTLNSYALTITTAGTGSGTVAANPAGPTYSYNTMVTLTATPSQGSTFTGWSGACTGASTCFVTMSQAQTVTATFALQSYALTINYAGNGSGTVHANPPGGTYTYNTQVTLTQTPAPGSTFTGWSGACTGASTCLVTMSQAQTVTATFALNKYVVTASVSGSGTLVSTPAGIDCPGSQCTASFDFGTPLQLVATPATNWLFDHWTGACASATSATCTTSVTGATSVSAVFVHDERMLTVQPTGNGIVASQPAGLSCPSSCAAPFDLGSTVTLTATAGVGASFSGWGGACSGTSSTCTVTIDQAYTVTATFTGNVYALTLGTTGNGNGAIAANPAGPSYAYNTTVTLTATAANGSQFAGWTGCTSSTNVCTVTMTAARSVTAAFTLVPETLTVSVTAGGSVASAPAGIACGTSCSAPFDYGTSVTLTATPLTGYNFTGWTGACSGQTGATCTLTMNAAASAGASFAPQQIELDTAAIGNGSGSISASPTGNACGPGCATYAYGANVTLTAAALPGSTFTGWAGCTSSTNTCTVTMNAAKSVTATFTLQQFALTTTTTGNGSGSIAANPPSGPYDYGTQVTLTATAALGSTFTGWTGCTSSTNVCTVTMNAAKSVSAGFALQQFTLSTTATGNGTGTITGAGTYNYGANVTVTANAGNGSTFTGWGGACTGSGTCTVVMDQARSVTATFTLQQFALTTTTSGTGSGAVTANPPGGTYDYNTQVTLTATAAQGSTFGGWTGCTSSSNVCVVTMTAAKTVNAAFTLQRFTVSATVTGSGSVTGTGPYDYGTQAVLTAVPASGNVFTGWGGACAGVTGTSCTLTVTAATSVTAAFAPDVKQLTVAVTGSGSVASAPAGITCGSSCAASFPTNSQVVLTATPSLGSTFTGWTGCSSTTSSCTVTMDQARSVTATFATNSYALTATQPTGGTIGSNVGGINCGSSCSANILYGTAVALTASPLSGWAFHGWGGTATCGSAATCTFNMPATAVSVSATFDPSLSVTVTGNGSVASSPAGIACSGGNCVNTFGYGSSVTLTATPAAHYHVTWSGACSGNATTCTVAMSQVQSVSAAFAPDTFTLGVSVGGDASGTVTVNGSSCTSTCSYTYTYGTAVSLTASPGSGAVFGGWGGACAGGSPCNLTITGATSVTAGFYQASYSFTVRAVKTGTLGSFTVYYPTATGQGTCLATATGNTCGATLPRGTQVMLSPIPSGTNVWSTGPDWTGCPSQSGDDCTFTLLGNVAATVSGGTENPSN